jgi:aryl-alcohol dehydrogenase-like predicted oxidoreductase
LEFRSIGHSGLRVSAVGVGASNFGGRMPDDAARQVVDKAFDLGVNFFDTADAYGASGGSGAGAAEMVLGDCLVGRRKDIVLASKFGRIMQPNGKVMGNSRRSIMLALEASLRRLRTDWIDLYYIHWPDPLVPREETLRALDDLVRQGKIRHVAHSNFSAWETADVAWLAEHHGYSPCIAAQAPYSLLDRSPERELIPALRQFGVGFIPYWPLASGLLSGRYKRGERPAAGSRFDKMKKWADLFLTESNFDIVERLDDFCKARGRTLIELAMSWLLAQPVVSSVIAGVSTGEQLAANVAAIGWHLAPDELTEVDRITRPTG